MDEQMKNVRNGQGSTKTITSQPLNGCSITKLNKYLSFKGLFKENFKKWKNQAAIFFIHEWNLPYGARVFRFSFAVLPVVTSGKAFDFGIRKRQRYLFFTFRILLPSGGLLVVYCKSLIERLANCARKYAIMGDYGLNIKYARSILEE